jgi:acetyl-CoA acetyltransferase
VTGGKFEERAIISGIGMSQVGRRIDRGALELTVESARAAVADAGLELSDIDGLITWPGEMAASAGFTGPSVFRVTDALALDLKWHSSVWEGPGQLNAVMNACLAVAGGLARHVLVYRTLTEATGQRGGGRSAEHAVDAGGVTGPLQWMRPFGSVSAANWLAPNAQRYLYDYGAKREQIGWLAVTLREHAMRNPTAVFRTPLTIDEYLGARIVSDPFCLFDCDVPVDGSVAVVVSAADYAADAPNAVRIEAVGSGQAGRPYWDQWRDPTDMAARYAARHLWTRTDLTPADVDTAQLYDGFSFLALVWLESLGFCGRGEAAAFVEGGDRIRFDGDLGLNTSGGQLSGGRLHGFGLLHEACTQLRGEAGERQVRGAEVAVAAAGGGPLGGCLLLTSF